MIGLSGVVAFGRDVSDAELPHGRVSGFPSAPGAHHGAGWRVELLDDAASGHVTSDGALRVFVVGEIYEDEVLAGRRSPAEAILAALRQGPLAATALNGSYAFLVLDEQRQRALLGTDENSFVPVYYAQDGETLCFSWDVSAVLRRLPQGPQLDEQVLWAWLLIGGRGFGDRTRFAGVRRVEPGSVVTFEAGRVTKQVAAPLSFEADGTAESQLLDEAAAALDDGVRRRLRGRNSLAIGLSGGLDSRLVLAAAVRQFEGRWFSYTYGRRGFAEHDIAQQVAAHYRLPHATIVFPDDHLYLEYAADGVFYSGGASLFKHGIQPHLFGAIRDRSEAQGLLLGSALDLVLGSTFSSGAVHDMRQRADLQDWHRRSLLNLSPERWRALFRDPHAGSRALDGAFALLEEAIARIPGEGAADVNDALAFDIRIKRWYNHNLVYPLLAQRLLTPTYDHAFLRVVSRVPAEWRRDSAFRIKLLTLVDRAVSDISYDETMQPAWLLPPHTHRFEKLVRQVDEERLRTWFDSGRTVYLPSNRYDANFLEWLRVYPRYEAFARDLLAGPGAVLAKRWFDPDALSGLISRHCSGAEANHKVITMLMSAELMARQFLEGDESGVHHQLRDFARFLP